MQQKKWIEVKAFLDPKYLEEISSYLFALGSDGVTENENSISIYFPEEVWSPESYALLKSIIGNCDAQVKLDLADVEFQNWNEKWKENFKPLQLTENCFIVPDWEKDFDSKDAYKIVISPKMAFGTGHHETTQLILMLLPKYIKKDFSVLDAGTGSAILAIHAAQLGAKSVLAFDNDPDAIENAEENVLQNGFENVITTKVATPDKISEPQFDLILANINRNVLLGLAKWFAANLKTDGTLILSGLLQTDFESIHQLYQNQGFNLIEKKARGEWLALVYKN